MRWEEELEMDITQLRYFLVTADTLNYTRAAEQLYMSRQALRQALTSMEEELGMPLFVNERNKLSLTVQGEYLQLSAAKVVEEFEKMMVDVKQFFQGQSNLRIGVSVSLFPFLIPEISEILECFQRKYPQIKVDVELITNDEVIDRIQDGGLECGALVQMKCRRSGIQSQPLVEYPAIISVGAELKEKMPAGMRVEDLADYQCIGMGSLEKTMTPLYEDCLRKNLSLRHEIVPDAIDAFYRISHSEAIGFDIGMENAPTIGKVFDCPLEGYTWEVGIIYPEKEMEKKEIQLLYRFVEEEYRKIRMRKLGG